MSNKTPLDHEIVLVNVRWFIRRDMADVLAIERSSFEYAWTEEDFLCCLRQRNCIGMVASVESEVLGFMIYELTHQTIRVINFAVHPAVRRLRIGSQMVSKLKDKLENQNRRYITLEVRESNLPAQLFFRSVGFRAVAINKDVYEGTSEAAYLMRYVKGESSNSHKFSPKNRISEYLA